MDFRKVNDLFDEVDVNGDGKIEFSEWVEWVVKQDMNHAEQKLFFKREKEEETIKNEVKNGNLMELEKLIKTPATIDWKK